jgi:hypothetical protein
MTDYKWADTGTGAIRNNHNTSIASYQSQPTLNTSVLKKQTMPVYGPVYNPPTQQNTTTNSPVASSTNTSVNTSGGSYLGRYDENKSSAELLKEQDPRLYSEINEYIDELKAEANGDYDFVVKFLKRQFETALGTDDVAKADFLAKVANVTEERVGRIPYDYDLMTGREKEDLNRYLQQADADDARQRQQEKEFEAQQQLAIEQEQKQVREGANERGMLDSGIEKRQSQEAQTTRETNVIEPQRSTFAYQQAMRNFDRSGAILQSQRNLADLTTDARRSAQDSQYSFDYGIEKANLSLEQRLAEIEREKSSQYRSGLALQTQVNMKDPVV